MTTILTVLAGIIGAVVTSVILRHSVRVGLIQHANHRSSHEDATPTAGGIGFVLSIAICAGFLCFSTPQIIGPLALALLIAAIGLADDIRPVAAKWRLLAQAIAVGSILFVLAGPLLIETSGPTLAALLFAALLLAGIWWVNLYNFLDGLDGYAATQGVFMTLAAAGFSLAGGADLQHPVIALMFITAAALGGFLIYNWPAAKIFMGDVGSTFLGFWLWCLMLMSVLMGWLSVWQWLLLSALFIIDASVTLTTRILRGQKPTEAHKDHVYQKLSRYFGGHRPVVLLALAVNIAFVLPTVFLAGLWPDLAPYVTGLTYLVLGIRAASMGAGRPD